MWKTSRTGSGFPLPASSFCCLAALPTENPAISLLLCLYKFNRSIHHTCLLCSLWYPRISSPHILHQTHHFSVLAHVSEDLSSCAGVHLSASGTSRSSLISVAPQHPIVRGSCQVCCRHGNHAAEWRVSCWHLQGSERPHRIQARWRSFSVAFVFVWDKSKRSQNVKAAETHAGPPSTAATPEQAPVWREASV